MAQFAYNSAVTETTKMLPFEANYGYCLVAYREPRTTERNAHYAQIDVDH